MKLRQYLARFLQVLLWTPANFLLSSTGHVSSSMLFSKFQMHEQFFQLKVVLIGMVGFATILGVSSILLQTIEYSLPSADLVQYYSLATSIGHVSLVILAMLGQYQKLMIFLRPFVFAVTSYVLLVPLMSTLIFTDQTFNAQIYLTSTSLMYIVATVYFQESFLISLFIWLAIFINCVTHLVNNSEVEQVSGILPCSLKFLRCKYFENFSLMLLFFSLHAITSYYNF